MKKRYLFLFILLGIFTIVFCPKAKAETTGYVTLEEVNNNGVAVANPQNDEGSILEYYLPNSENSSFKLLGHSLAPVGEGESNIVIKSTTPGGWSTNSTTFDVINSTGLIYQNEFQENSYWQDYPYFTATLTHSKDNSRIKIRYGTVDCDGLKMYYVNPDIFAAMKEAFDDMTDNGKLELDTVEPDPLYTDSMVTAALSKYNTDDFVLSGWCDDDACYIVFTSTAGPQIYDKFEVEYIFSEENENVKDKVQSFVDSFMEEAMNHGGVTVRLEDLENLNYLYTFQKHPTTSMDMVNAVVLFSSQAKALVGNTNLGISFDMRMGEDATLYSMAFGMMPISYDGVIYGVADGVGYERVNVIYVSDDTELDRDALISAAKARVEEYLPDAEVSIEYKAGLDTLSDEEKQFIDVDKTNGEYFTLTLDGEEYDFFIVKDSEKIQTPEMLSIDILTDVRINTNSSEVPLDATIEVEKLDKNSDEYKELMKKLNITDGESFDFGIYSETAEVYVSKLNDGKFKVYIPLSEEYSGKKLTAYYLKEDGNKEEHEVTIEKIDGKDYAVFETDHFSTYTLATTEDTNPPTGDKIMTYVGIGAVSMILLVGLGIATYRNKKVKDKH